MCGILATSNQQALPILVEGLRRLEYRQIQPVSLSNMTVMRPKRWASGDAKPSSIK